MKSTQKREAGAVHAVTRRIRQRMTAEVLRRLYRHRRRDMPSAILAGAGRSGTTWIAELIDAQVRTQLLFEPFNPYKVDEYRSFRYFQYMAIDGENEALRQYCEMLLEGRIRGAWVDGHLAHLRPQLRLIKGIRCTLMLGWLRQQFERLPILLTMRHPAAVVLSRMRLEWATDGDIAHFLAQPALVHDQLQPYMDVIGEAKTDEEKHAVIWCVSNLVPLRQLGKGGATLLYYERMRAAPDTELPRLCKALNIEFSGDLAALARPSRTTRTGSGRTSGPARADWQKHLSGEQIRRILNIVEAFGLAHIYGDSPTPLPTAPL